MLKQYLCVFALAGLIGCSSISGIPDRSVDAKVELTTLLPYFAANVISTYEAKSTKALKRAYRNDVVSARVRAIDIQYSEFIQDISAENKRISIGTDTAVLFLGGFGAVSTVTSSQAIISATSAMITGVKTSIDKNAYYDSTLNALLTQMDANRREALVAIYRGVESNIEGYPLLRALIDTESYFQAGTIMGAVSEINKNAGVTKAGADKKIENIVEGNYQKDKTGDLIRTFWKPDGSTTNTANAAKITKWIKDNDLGTLSITMLMRSDALSQARNQAVSDLGL
jgi:hypothetical protein